MARPLYNLRCFRAGLKVARIMPRGFSRRLAAQIGVTIYRKKACVEAALHSNLGRVTGGKGAALDGACERNVRCFSRMLADYFYCAGRSPKVAAALVHRWHGYEHLAEARARGKGVIVVTAHLGHWELGGILLAQRGLPMTVITLDEPTSALTAWRDGYRQRAGINTIPVGPGREFAFVEMMQTLRRNECLAMLVDRPYEGTGIPVQFFGAETEFSSGPAILWQHTGAAVVPAFVVEDERGEYISFAEPIVEMTKSGDQRESQIANTQALATVFERIIRRYPEQWFNYVPMWPTPKVEAAAAAHSA